MSLTSLSLLKFQGLSLLTSQGVCDSVRFVLKEFPREVLSVFVLLIISENDQISIKRNFRK